MHEIVVCPFSTIFTTEAKHPTADTKAHHWTWSGGSSHFHNYSFTISFNRILSVMP